MQGNQKYQNEKRRILTEFEKHKLLVVRNNERIEEWFENKWYSVNLSINFLQNTLKW